jgi:hypothetical protein
MLRFRCAIPINLVLHHHRVNSGGVVEILNAGNIELGKLSVDIMVPAVWIEKWCLVVILKTVRSQLYENTLDPRNYSTRKIRHYKCN